MKSEDKEESKYNQEQEMTKRMTQLSSFKVAPWNWHSYVVLELTEKYQGAKRQNTEVIFNLIRRHLEFLTRWKGFQQQWGIKLTNASKVAKIMLLSYSSETAKIKSKVTAKTRSSTSLGNKVQKGSRNHL